MSLTSCTVEDFKASYPEFNDVDDSIVAAAFIRAECMTPKCIDGCGACHVQYLKTAHILVAQMNVSPQAPSSGGGAGCSASFDPRIKKQKTGQLETEYFATLGTGGGLSSSVYGQALQQLIHDDN